MPRARVLLIYETRMTEKGRSKFFSWQARVLMAGVGGAGALVAVFRATQPRTEALRIQPDIAALEASAPTFERMLELYTGTHFDSGNHVEILLNGNGTYPRLWNDLRSARKSITVQSYYSMPGALADTLSLILRNRARAGVRVRLLLDAFGSEAMPNEWLSRLRLDGVQVALLRPLQWHTLHGSADRSHVRVVVVDGRVGYTGGFGFADYWSGDGRHPAQWRETNVRVEGPAAAQLQSAFAAGWLEATGEFMTNRGFFDLGVASVDSGSSDAGLLFTATTTGSTQAERFLVTAILSARKHLYITNSYFVPNKDFRQLLSQAVVRGVDVRILTAGPHSDVKTTRFAGRYHYEELLRSGVRIYEYDVAMMHAKTLIVDGVWTAIGSMNFDNRSLAFNDESTLVVCDSTVARRMDAVFRDDLDHAIEITMADFLQRSTWQRTLEFSANLLSALL
jgi:cardiolipin synthase A/B